MKIRSLFLSAALLSFLLPAVAQAAGPDVYLVYAGADRPLHKELKMALKGRGKIKSYNTDLLALADYSGKQKVTAKLSSAKLVVVLPGANSAIGNLQGIAVLAVSKAEDLERIRAAMGLSD